ncbi:YbjN domain-containing protein [Abyssibius alkaniclasticus]|uniref:YbjN domain-containing protein n=1 Tax=Abyssibius alkaniclasticus TaxID=2881234 RepID=UPI0023635C74|nr:YbjN domain-containing protein [Abyssibius alkaniclasticus]UPH71443.1 YbjN domain-containing protein [Abyssibius alkaniclasticus]|tara:strand:- start:1181 stop:1645 length:465 start_codon:yes stop_codon:yes gene_type:complete
MRKIPHFAAAFTLLATSVFAENVTAADPQGMVAALQELGYRATLDRSSNGRPFIESSANGVGYRMWFYSCDDAFNNCRAINLSVGFNLIDGTTPGVVNEWNMTKLVGRAYLDEDFDPWLDFYFVANAPIQMDTFELIIAQWGRSMGQFKEHIDF